MLNAIPFSLPAELLGRVAAGELVRYGTILKDAATGRIVGHVQETGLGHALLSNVVGGVPTPFSLIGDVVNAAVGIDTNRQVRHVKQQVVQLQEMMRAFQILQIANLAVSVVGVGVTVAGFVYMHRRLNALDGKLALVMETMQAGFDEQRRATLRRQMSRVHGLVRRAQEAQHSTVARVEFREIAAALSDQAAYFSGEVQFVVSLQDRMDAALLQELTQALMLCNSLRIDCQIRTNELRHALSTSESVALDYQHLFDPLTPMSFGKLPLDEAKSTLAALRDVTDAAASQPYLIDTLRTHRIQGDRYIDTLEREQDHPLFVLRTG